MNDATPPSSDPSDAATRLLVVDDETVILDFLGEVLAEAGYDVSLAPGGAHALDMLAKSEFDLVVTDLKMPHIGGIEVLAAASRRQRRVLTIVMTGYATVETAIEALKLGAEDYVTKPFKIDEILMAVERADQRRRLVLANERYRQRLEAKVRERTEQLRRAHDELQHSYDETLRSISALLELKDT